MQSEGIWSVEPHNIETALGPLLRTGGIRPSRTYSYGDPLSCRADAERAFVEWAESRSLHRGKIERWPESDEAVQVGAARHFVECDANRILK